MELKPRRTYVHKRPHMFNTDVLDKPAQRLDTRQLLDLDTLVQ